MCSPDEYPFTNHHLPNPVLRPLDFPKILYPNNVNANAEILKFYTADIVPRITKQATEQLSAAKRAKGIVRDGEADDDGNYGSAATADVEVLQTISKRVHYGAVPLIWIFIPYVLVDLTEFDFPQANLSPSPSLLRTPLLSFPIFSTRIVKHWEHWSRNQLWSGHCLNVWKRRPHFMARTWAQTVNQLRTVILPR